MKKYPRSGESPNVRRGGRPKGTKNHKKAAQSAHIDLRPLPFTEEEKDDMLLVASDIFNMEDCPACNFLFLLGQKCRCRDHDPDAPPLSKTSVINRNDSTPTSEDRARDRRVTRRDR